jgi:deazaflavin-dependent oxidoreductase (nitroreductase family)
MSDVKSEDLFGPEHVRRYQETDGKLGYDWKRGSKILLLSTTGRKSGDTRIMPLIFEEDGDRYVIVASKGGMPEHPAWYLNLRDDPNVQVQVRGDIFDATASTVPEGEERDRLWKKMAAVWPDYDAYQEKTDRQIPIVVLERA